MSDRFGFPRRSEALAKSIPGGTWKALWTVPSITATGNALYQSPVCIPGSYFRSAQGLGAPFTANTGRHVGFTPMVRVTGASVGVTTIFYSLNNHGSATLMNLLDPGAGNIVFTTAHLFMHTPALMRYVTQRVDDAGVALATNFNFIYGGQDIWFQVQTNPSAYANLVFEYLESPQ